VKVFISYAREDIEMARKLRDDLEKAGINTWLDKVDLLPGQDWKTEVSRAIRTSSHFIALLSTRSISKQGFFQTELKKAIDVLDTFPEQRIYFIPVRIDNCDPGYERLQNIHWADLFPSYEEGLSQILRVLAPDSSEAKENHTPKLKYQLRKESITTDDPMSAFRLNEKWRSLEYIQNDLRDNGDETITDYATGLMWQKSGSDNRLPYEKTKEYIKELNYRKFAGYSDWRLPSVDELLSLQTKKHQSNDMYIDLIFDKKQWVCWTSVGVWNVYFNYGHIDWVNLHGYYYVRAVRSIQ